MKVRSIKKLKDNILINPNTFRNALGTWYPYFKDFLKTEDFSNIYEYLNFRSNQTIITPQYNNIFNSFKYCDINDLKLIVITENPTNSIRNKKPCANGIGVSSDIRTLEVDNFYDCIEIDQEEKIQKSFNLRYLAEQGILFLNVSLTSEVNSEKSHLNAQIWQPFHNYLFRNILKDEMLPIIAFGKHTSNITSLIDPRLCDIKTYCSLSSIYPNYIRDQQIIAKAKSKIFSYKGTEGTIIWNEKYYKQIQNNKTNN